MDDPACTGRALRLLEPGAINVLMEHNFGTLWQRCHPMHNVDGYLGSFHAAAAARKRPASLARRSRIEMFGDGRIALGEA